MTKEKKIKVLLAQFSLETHSRGIITVASMLRDEGFEVIYIGNSTPEQIITASIQEDVDVVGISTLCGGELVLGRDLLQIAKENEVQDKLVFLMGGIFPPEDIPKLKEIGFKGIFSPGASQQEISSLIKELVPVS